MGGKMGGKPSFLLRSNVLHLSRVKGVRRVTLRSEASLRGGANALRGLPGRESGVMRTQHS